MLTPEARRTLSRAPATTLLLVAVLACAGLAQADDAGVVEVLRQAIAEDAPYRNAVYLHLRLAGAVWIAVEWAAALLLWRGHRLLARAVASREGP